jgi:hypothetical protein
MSTSDRILTNNNYHDVSKIVSAHNNELQVDIKPVILKNKRRRSNRSANSENTADDSDGKSFIDKIFSNLVT